MIPQDTHGIEGRPVIFGEVLFDQFEDGTAVLGGAPFNVAWHLQGFGLSPLLISRVGEDAHGEAVREAMHGWGMVTTGLQSHPDRPTGTVRVSVKEGQPSFDIVADQAYDFIDAGQACSALRDVRGSLLYHGTLATRHELSRAALVQVQEASKLPRFVDINLRPPWWDKARVAEALIGAAWLKLNEHELAAVEQRSDLVPDAYEHTARAVLERNGIRLLVLTLGAEGACLVDVHGMRCGEPVPVANLIDTVGAGDAFSAATVFGLSAGWPEELTLSRALEFASVICAQRGATKPDRALYERLLQRWVR